MKKKSIIILIITGLIILILGIILLTKNNNILKEKSKIQIIDATFSCAQAKEVFYENEENTYLFPCVKTGSIYVKFENGNKMLIKDALNSEQISIDELVKALKDADIEFYIEKK